MSHSEIIRAWRDESFWLGLSEDQRERIPVNPAGSTELLDAELGRVVGGEEEARSREAWNCRNTTTVPTCDHCFYTNYSGGDRDPCCD